MNRAEALALPLQTPMRHQLHDTLESKNLHTTMMKNKKIQKFAGTLILAILTVIETWANRIIGQEMELTVLAVASGDGFNIHTHSYCT
jgi:hypothetical protein